MSQTLKPSQPDDVPIRDAACVIVVDHRESEPRVLLGQRRADQVFLPDKWVFPGGRVDPEDATRAAALSATRYPQDLARFAVAAIRELDEETGLVLDAGAEEALEPVARAITPPGRPRRFDTWFFMADRASVKEHRANTDEELLHLGWFTLAETRRLDLPNITRLIVNDVESRLQDGANTMVSGVPFYFADTNGFQRALINFGCGTGKT